MNCHCGRALVAHPNYPRLYAPCPCRMKADTPPVRSETLERIRAGIERLTDDAASGPLEELRPPMEWLCEELPSEIYKRALLRHKEFRSSSTIPTERRNAMREAFWWGHFGTTEYKFWEYLNKKWRQHEEE